MNSKNPFCYGRIITGEFFFQRKEEILSIKRQIINQKSCWLFSKRRTGKSSLLKEIKTSSKDLSLAIVDCYQCSSAKAFIEITSKEICSIYMNEYGEDYVSSNILNETSVLNYEIIKKNGKKEINFTLNNLLIDDGFNDLFSIIKKIKDEKPLAIALDEFQNLYVTDENILKKIRSFIEENPICFIFSGSKKDILSNIFEEESGLLFQSADKILISEIQRDDWSKYLSTTFKKTSTPLPDNILKLILDISQNHPYFIQKVAYFTWELMSSDVDIKKNESILIENLFKNETSFFRELMDNCTPNQRKTLILLAKTNGIGFFKSEGLDKFNLNKSTVERCIDSLEKSNMISRDSKKVLFENPMFQYWLLFSF